MKKAIIILLFVVGVAAYSFIPTNTVTTKAQLGEKLFHEKLLSKDKTLSCASCHIPQYGFADTVALSTGIYGMPTSRNTPSVLNMKNRPYYFWDGRAATLEQQSLIPLTHPNEMGLPITQAINRLNNNATYRHLFLKIFKQKPNPQNLAAAFAAFERTLETGQSKFDLSFDGKATLTPQEEWGRQLFLSDRTHCFDCHSGEDFTNDQFKNIGLYDGITHKDKGRFLITKDSTDLGKFKVPGLRNVAVTAPYMHNGMFKTLEEVIEYYDHATYLMPDAINMDTVLYVPLGLSKEEKAALVAFLQTLTDKRYIRHQQK